MPLGDKPSEIYQLSKLADSFTNVTVTLIVSVSDQLWLKLQNESSTIVSWCKIFGDRKNEIVFIGQDMDEEQIISDLDDCLLSNQDLKKRKMEKWLWWQLASTKNNLVIEKARNKNT